MWGDEDWVNATCEVILWSIDSGERCTVCVVAEDGRMMDVDEGNDGEGACTCNGKGETENDGKEGEDEDAINWTDGLLVGGDGSAKFIDACSNGFAIEVNVDVVMFSFNNSCSQFR